MKFEQIPDVQKWLPFERILEKGIIKMKNSSYIKILKVYPINYNLKSDLEKQAILNSYNIFFKTFNSKIQILIQSKKEDLNENIKLLKNNNYFKEIKEKYIYYLKELDKTSKSSNKNFYLIITKDSNNKDENVVIEEIQNDYQKVKELLLRCGNIVSEYTKEKDIIEIIKSFFSINI